MQLLKRIHTKNGCLLGDCGSSRFGDSRKVWVLGMRLAATGLANRVSTVSCILGR